MSFRHALVLGVVAVSAVSFTACNKSADKSASADAKPAETAAAGHSHSDWWCSVHGVPEAQCAQCDPKLAAEMKAKGDWCEEHNRPESQCFICNPDKEKEFADLYEAKFGKQPPKRAAEGSEPADEHESHEKT